MSRVTEQWDFTRTSGNWNAARVSGNWNTAKSAGNLLFTRVMGKFGVLPANVLPAGYYYIVDYQGKNITDSTGKMLIGKTE
jgi:hypothetical protein